MDSCKEQAPASFILMDPDLVPDPNKISILIRFLKGSGQKGSNRIILMHAVLRDTGIDLRRSCLFLRSSFCVIPTLLILFSKKKKISQLVKISFCYPEKSGLRSRSIFILITAPASATFQHRLSSKFWL